MKTIHGYELKGELTSQNAGFCQWGFCTKGGHEYFIKEFLDPKYPVDRELFTPEAFERKVKICDDFFKEKTRFYQTLEKCRTGNNIIIQDFFLEGTKYYIVTDRVEPTTLTLKEVSCLSSAKKEALIRSILYSIASLHEAGIVHSDIKADNILLKETPDGFITAKIIDFDAGFLLDAPQSTVKGDFVYLSPEAYLKMKGENIVLTEKIDIFALGLLFHQYLTGELPKFPEEDRYVCLSLLNGNEVALSNALPPFYSSIIMNMLSVRPEDRRSAREILNLFGAENQKTGRDNKVVDKEVERDTTVETQTGGSGLKKTGFYVPKDLG